MNPKEFLELADILTGEYRCTFLGSEAAQRTSISRSYYGIFISIRNFLIEKRVAIKSGAEAHMEVYAYLQVSDEPDLKTIGGELKTLRKRRNTADYDLQQRWRSNATDTLRLAKKNVGTFFNFPKMESWLKKCKTREYQKQVNDFLESTRKKKPFNPLCFPEK